MKKNRKAIFLDRDGVLNHVIMKNGKPYSPSTFSEVFIPSDAKQALQSLKSVGYLLIGATNQPDVARGRISKEVVEAINSKLMFELPLDEIRVCYHDDVDKCLCRKPSPGLLIDAATQYGIDLKKSVMIGDRWKDVEAGYNAGCKTVWMHQSYQEKKPDQYDFMASSLTAAAEWILKIAF